jgi:hypothetical protein
VLVNINGLRYKVCQYYIYIEMGIKILYQCSYLQIPIGSQFIKDKKKGGIYILNIYYLKKNLFYGQNFYRLIHKIIKTIFIQIMF